MLVRFACGCIGVRGISDEEGRSLVLKHCDSSDGQCYGPCFRNMSQSDKHVAADGPISPAEVEELVTEFRKLIMDGYRMREIRALLKD